MRNVASVYLWKEWREQRSTLGVLASMLLGCAGVVAAVVPRRFACDPIVPPWIVGLTVLATVTAIGADLIPRERQRGSLGFLERVPAGLAHAFRAKLVFFVLALGAAFLYGALLASGVWLWKSGELHEFDVLSGASVWTVLAVAVSLWVFAVSAWMPSGALTVPATAFFLASFAWPGVLAASGEAPFHASTAEALAFLGLCVVGAPASAWASFVVGSRRGASRARAACIGLAVAAVFFFSPAWAWAAVRYANFGNARFEILHACIGPGERFAFLTLGRQQRPETDGRDDRCTAAIVDLEQGAWRFAGEVDRSFIAEEQWYQRRASLLGLGACERFELYSDTALDTKTLLDARTSSVVSGEELEPRRPASVEPADFGLSFAPRGYRLRWAGLGQAISFQDAEGKSVELFRDPASGRVVERDRILPELRSAEWCEVRIRHGRWLAGRHSQGRRSSKWIWFDPDSGAREDVACIAPDETLGPSIDDDRFVLIAGGDLFLLDPETAERQAVADLSERDLDWRFIGGGSPWSAPLRVDRPTVVHASADRWSGLALLDVRARTLRLAATPSGRLIRLLTSQGTQAITLEDCREIVRYDVERGTREVLFTLDALE